MVIGAGLSQRSSPLTGTGLGGQGGQALLLGIVGLGNGRIQLVAAGGVIALKFVVDLGRGAQFLFQVVGPDQRRGTVDLVHGLDFLGNVHIAGLGVHLLMSQSLAEHRIEVLFGSRLAGFGIEHRLGLFLHIRPEVVPLGGHLVFSEEKTIGNLFHLAALLFLGPVPIHGTVPGSGRQRKSGGK